MKPSTRLQEVTKSLFLWSSFHAQWKTDFDSYALKTPDGVLLVDPMKPAPAVIKKIRELGEPCAILLTNAHHDRDADWFRKEYGIQIYAHQSAKSDCDTKIDVLILDDETLPGGVKAIHLPGSSASETAFYTKAGGGIVLTGDSILHLPDDGLSLLPEPYIEDRKQALKSLAKLLDLDFKVITFAHGEPLTENAKRQISAFLKKSKKRSS